MNHNHEIPFEEGVMPNYRVLSTEISHRCPHGNGHINRADISLGIGHQQTERGETLYQLGGMGGACGLEDLPVFDA